MSDTQEFSIKGQGNVLWRGLTDSSEQAPSDGYFNKMENAVFSRDGTEIRSFPGSGLVAEPGYYGHRFLVTGVTTGSTTRLHLTPYSFDTMIPATTIGRTVKAYIKGVRTQSSSLPDGEYTVTRAGGRSVDVAVDTTGETFALVQAEIRVQVSWTPMRLTYANGFLCVIGESTIYWYDGSRQKRAVAVWTESDPMDFDNVRTQWQYWPSTINDTRMQPIASSDPFRGNTLEDNPARFRPGVDESNGYLIIPTPGHGVVQSCYLDTERLRINDQDLGQWTQALGVPKAAIVWGETGGILWKRGDGLVNGVNLGTTAGIGGNNGNGYVTYLSVAYRNRVTGRVGLASRPLRVTTPGYSLPNPNGLRNAYIKLVVTHPRDVLLECADLSIVVYCTGEGGDAPTGFFPIDEVPVFNQIIEDQTIYIFNITRANSWITFPGYPREEQMPMGASFAKTMRGFTVYGGAVAQGVDGSVSPGTPPLYDDDFFKERILVTNQTTLDRQGNPTRGLKVLSFQDAPRNVTGSIASNYRLPPAYFGSVIQALLDESLPIGEGGNKGRVLLDDMPQHQLFTVTERFIRDLKGGTDRYGVDVILPRGRLWIGKQGLPGIAPAPRQIQLDLLEGLDFRAAGRMGDNMVLCTERETYMISFARDPLGATPRLITDVFGCIAPNSMVEFPGGLAWLSADGPVVMGSDGVFWAGRAIRKRWEDTYLADSRGLMWHATGTFDTERNSVVWSLRSDWKATTFASATSDESKSATIGDELLIYNIASQGFTVQRHPSGLGHYDVSMGRHVDGKLRLTSINDDHNIYQTDDGYADQSKNSLVAVATANKSGVTFTASATDFSSGIPSNSNGVIYDSAGVVQWAGNFFGGSNGSATLIGTGTWKTGDSLELKLHKMELETVFLRHSDLRHYHRLAAVHIYYTLYKAEGVARAWAKIEIVDQAGNVTAMHDTIAEPMEDQHVLRVDKAFAVNLSDSQIRITTWSNCQVRIKDITVDVGRGG